MKAHNNNEAPTEMFEGVTWSAFMEAANDLLVSRINSYSNGNRSKLSLHSIAIEKLTNTDIDKIVDSYSDLIDPNYRAWFIKQLKRIGKQKFIECGDRARKYGRNPQKLFSQLVRE